MIIKSIELNNFRNYEHIKIDLSEGINIIYGENAVGKTNILESAYMSGTTKSHKGSKDKECIKIGCEEAHIKTVVDKNNKEYTIDIHLKKNKTKGIAVNKIPLKKASDIFGILNIVVFSPEDLNIIKEGPSERRRFIDSELCQIDKIYLNDLKKYNKIIDQRNSLLKSMYEKKDNISTLDVWDEQLINYGKKIILRRYEFIDDIKKEVRNIHSKISGYKEEIDIDYEPDVLTDNYEKELKNSRDKDIRTGYTNIGPHKDDIKIIVNGIDIRKYGSQGQQRTCALSLKLSEISLMERKTGEKPVLLMDDVLSELDRNRQEYLLDSMYENQTVITCTGIDEFINKRTSVNMVYEVKNGSIIRA